MINRVWVAQRGERGEGGSIIGIYDNKLKAIKKALEEKAHSASGWKEVSRTHDRIEFEAGCDYLIVEKRRVL